MPIWLNIKSEFSNIVWRHNIIFAFSADFSGLLGGLFASGFDQIVEIYNLGGNKSSLEICVNYARGLWCCPAFSDCPSVNFFWSGGHIALKAERVVSGVDHLVESSFFDAVAFEKLFCVFLAKTFEFFFQFCGHKNRTRRQN